MNLYFSRITLKNQRLGASHMMSWFTDHVRGGKIQIFEPPMTSKLGKNKVVPFCDKFFNNTFFQHHCLFQQRRKDEYLSEDINKEVAVGNIERDG